MKKFGFALPEELHRELRSAAESQNTSMAAICREALTAHLHQQQNPYFENAGEIQPDSSDPRIAYESWTRLKNQINDYLCDPEIAQNPYGDSWFPNTPIPYSDHFRVEEPKAQETEYCLSWFDKVGANDIWERSPSTKRNKASQNELNGPRRST